MSTPPPRCRTTPALVATGVATSIAAAGLLALSATPVVAQPTAALQRAEQLQQNARRTDRPDGRRLARYSTVGAMTGAGLALGYWAISEGGLRGGACQPLNCALPYLTASGAFAGLFLGRELELQRMALAPREGAILRLAVEAIPLPAEPLALLRRDSLVVIASDSGIVMGTINSGGAMPVPRALARRATGLRDARALTWLSPSETASARVLLGTATAMWDVPLAGGVSRRVTGGGAMILATSEGPAPAVVSANGRYLRRHDAGTAMIRDSVDMGAAIRAVHWDTVAEHWWVATDSALIGTSASSARPIIQLDAGASVRAISTSAAWIVVASGENGVRAWARQSLRAGGVITPQALQGEPRFAYDVAFHRDTLYVAGGVDGVFLVALDPVPRVLGSTRQGGFATLLRSAPDGMWVGDRGSRALLRIR